VPLIFGGAIPRCVKVNVRRENDKQPHGVSYDPAPRSLPRGSAGGRRSAGPIPGDLGGANGDSCFVANCGAPSIPIFSGDSVAAPILFSNLQIELGDPNNFFDLYLTNSFTVFYGCSLAVTNGDLVFGNSLTLFGLDQLYGFPSGGGIRADLPTLLFGAVDPVAWVGYGVSITDTFTNVLGGKTAGYLVMDETVAAPGSGVLEIGASNSLGATAPASSLTMVDGSVPAVNVLNGTFSMFAGHLLGSTLFALRAVFQTSIARIFNGSINTTGAAPAIIAKAGGEVYLGSNVTGSAVAPALSVDARLGGYVVIGGAPNFGRAVDLDYDVGNGAPQNKTFFGATGVHMFHTDGSIVERITFP
jgi:hypothetical protein